MTKGQKYIVKCIKGNNNKCGFGYRYKSNQYVSFTGKPVSGIQNAHIYEYKNYDNDCAIRDVENWEQYFCIISIQIKLQKRIKI